MYEYECLFCGEVFDLDVRLTVDVRCPDCFRWDAKLYVDEEDVVYAGEL